MGTTTRVLRHLGEAANELLVLVQQLTYFLDRKRMIVGVECFLAFAATQKWPFVSEIPCYVFFLRLGRARNAGNSLRGKLRDRLRFANRSRFGREPARFERGGRELTRPGKSFN